jgi:hypothetical protein
LHSHTLLVPQKRSVKGTWTSPAFSTNGIAGRVYWSRALMGLVCEVALITTYPMAFQLCSVYQVTGTIDGGRIRGLSGRQEPGQVSNPSQTLGRIFCEMTAFNFHDSGATADDEAREAWLQVPLPYPANNGAPLALAPRSTYSEMFGHIPGPGWVVPGPVPPPGPCFPFAHLGPLPHAYGKGCLARGMGLGSGQLCV